MKKFTHIFIMFCFFSLACFCLNSCEKASAEAENTGDISADDWISPTFTMMNLGTGLKTNERVSNKDLKYFKILFMKDWNPQNGDIFFFRGEMAWSPNEIQNDAEWAIAIVPLENDFYWNGVGLYQDGFLYRIMPTEEGPRIYNSGLWTLGGYCVIVQASSSLALPDIGINTEMLKNIHKLKVKRGHLKAAIMNPNMNGAFTPPGLLWQYYRNQGKEIRKAGADEYIRAEDFIGKTSPETGYFESLTPELTIRKVSIYQENASFTDCSKVY